MIRSLAIGLVALTASTGATAQTCIGNPVAVQVLGSGAPGYVKDRANTSYLLWVGNQAKILMDTGGGSYGRFAQSGARFQDISLVLISHLHPDHVSDLPAVMWSARQTRRDALPVFGPTGDEAAPAFTTFVSRLFDPKTGAYEVLGSVMASAPSNPPQMRIDAHDLDVTSTDPLPVWDRDGIKVTAMGIPHGNLPNLAYRIETRGKTVVYSSDQNGTNPRFAGFAQGADLLIMHLAIGVGANNPIQALPLVVGQVAENAQPKRLVLSHIGNFDVDAAVADVKKTYTGPLTIAADLGCYQAQ
ncbi:MAG TPA: MBL fold metallo-hydrolase [Micropepsaceae bacterium]|nr:MBL fold metallo-hydrolase [Micropepsaceae bacterium]